MRKSKRLRTHEAYHQQAHHVPPHRANQQFSALLYVTRRNEERARNVRRLPHQMEASNPFPRAMFDVSRIKWKRAIPSPDETRSGKPCP
jgi:hypothetical protein